MNQLKCEMCGSTDIVKQDGMFVCQVCGTKYSVEEAKKMMVEGVVEIKNAAQFDNLLNMARSSYNSNNFAKAEEFCNQVIAMDDRNYEAWKIKGMAINAQISAINPRILEAYNCLMTAYRVAPNHADDIFALLIKCFDGEIKYWVEQIEHSRPSKQSLDKAKSTYEDCYNKFSDAIDELGLTELKEETLSDITNMFIIWCNTTCAAAWKAVATNYYRDDAYNLGANWYKMQTVAAYRPLDITFKTFLAETDILIELELYAEKQFNKTTFFRQKDILYSNVIYFNQCLIDAHGYDLTTSPYYTEPYWTESIQLNDAAKKERRATIAEYEQKQKENQEAERKSLINKYFDENPDQKIQYDELQNQKKQLSKQIDSLQKSIEPLKQKQSGLEIHLKKLIEEKNALGFFFFKLKEKKAIQEKIDIVEKEKDNLSKQINEEQQKIDKEVTPIKNQLSIITNQITVIESKATK